MSCIFINNCFSNDNNIYNNVLLNTGSNNIGEWNNQICVLNETKKIIKFSNSFINDYFSYEPFYVKYQNDNYKIYDNLEKNYKDLVNSKEMNIIYVKETFFYMINPFIEKNIGHDLSCILNQLSYVLNNDITHIVIMKDYMNTNNFKLIKFMIPTHIQFIELEYNKIYNFSKIIIPQQIIANLYLHKKLIDNIIENIKIINNTYDYDSKYKKIIIMKTNRNKNVFVKHTSHQCESFLKILETKYDYLNIIPEEMDIFYLSNILLNATHIITSDGCISFYNHIFFNKNAKIIYIGDNKLYVNILNINNNLKLHIDKRLNDNSNEYLEIIEQIIYNEN